MTFHQCPHCKKFAPYEFYNDYDEVDEGYGKISFDTYDIIEKERYDRYDAKCPHCGKEFSVTEVYILDHIESTADGEGEDCEYNLDDVKQAEEDFIREVSA
jgi:hypothetical protein